MQSRHNDATRLWPSATETGAMVEYSVALCDLSCQYRQETARKAGSISLAAQLLLPVWQWLASSGAFGSGRKDTGMGLTLQVDRYLPPSGKSCESGNTADENSPRQAHQDAD